MNTVTPFHMINAVTQSLRQPLNVQDFKWSIIYAPICLAATSTGFCLYFYCRSYLILFGSASERRIWRPTIFLCCAVLARILRSNGHGTPVTNFCSPRCYPDHVVSRVGPRSRVRRGEKHRKPPKRARAKDPSPLGFRVRRPLGQCIFRP